MSESKESYKKVLRPAVEIFQLEAAREDRNFMSLAVVALAMESLSKFNGMTKEEIFKTDGRFNRADDFPDEWFTEVEV